MASLLCTIRITPRRSSICWYFISAATNCHCSHACDNFLLRSLFSAPPNMNFSRFISAATYCHFSHAIDSLRKRSLLTAPLIKSRFPRNKLPLLPCHRQLPVDEPV